MSKGHSETSVEAGDITVQVINKINKNNNFAVIKRLLCLDNYRF